MLGTMAIASSANFVLIDDARQSTVERGMRKNWPLRLQISGEFDRQTGFAKKLVTFSCRIHCIQEITAGKKWDGALFIKVAMRLKNFRVACSDFIHLRGRADSDNAQR